MRYINLRLTYLLGGTVVKAKATSRTIQVNCYRILSKRLITHCHYHTLPKTLLTRH